MLADESRTRDLADASFIPSGLLRGQSESVLDFRAVVENVPRARSNFE
jgi:hypothetical protein